MKGKPQILKGIKDKKTGKIIPPKNVKVSDKLSVPFEPKETNIQFKSDKLDLDYGKRFAQRDGLTAAERKRKLQKLKRDLNIKNPTITSPVTGGQIPATATNLKKYNLPPLKKTRVKAPNYDELKRKNKKIVKKLKNIVKSKPSTSGLYDPLKTKIPNLEPLKPLRTFIKPSITKTATKSKGLLPKLLGAVRKKPKGALGVGLLAVGAYGAIKNRIKTKTPAPNKNKLLPGGLGNRETVIDPLDVTYKIVGNKNR